MLRELKTQSLWKATKSKKKIAVKKWENGSLKFTYRSEDQEARKEIENRVKSRGNNSRNLMIGCQCYGHHSIVCEVQQGEERNKHIPKELWCSPCEINH